MTQALIRRALSRRASEISRRLATRVADDLRFWSQAIFNARVARRVLAVVLALVILVLAGQWSPAVAVAIDGFVALQWGGLLTPTTAILAVIFVLVSYASRAKPTWAAFAALFAYVFSFAMSNMWRLAEERELALQLYQMGAFNVLFILCLIIWLAVRHPERLREGDIAAQMYWTVYLVAEFWQIVEYLGCKILYDPYTAAELATLWGTVVEASSCGRAFGAWSQHAAPVVTTAILAWLVIRFWQAWNPPQAKPPTRPPSQD